MIIHKFPQCYKFSHFITLPLLGLLGYLIPFVPLAFVSQCRPCKVLSPLVFFPISTHFTAPPEIPFAPTVLQLGSFHRLSRVEPWDLTADLKSHLQTLYVQSFRITLASFVLPRLLAQSQPMFIPQIPSLLLLWEKKFTTRGPSTSTRHCSVRRKHRNSLLMDKEKPFQHKKRQKLEQTYNNGLTTNG